MRGRNSPVYEGVGYPLPFFATPSLLCLEPHCDCNDPLPHCAPGAAIIVVIWGFSVSFWLFVLQEFGETRELEQAVETALPWESKSKRPPRWPFSYMWEIHLQSQVASRKNSVSHSFYKFKKDQCHSSPHYTMRSNVTNQTTATCIKDNIIALARRA